MSSADSSEWEFPNRATPPGSAEYYAVQFSASEKRSLNAMLLAWHQVVRDICDRPQDPGVARLKLDWWRNEIDAFASGRMRHPLLRTLHGLRLDNSATGPMQRVVDAAEAVLQRPQISDDDEFVIACRGDGGTLFNLLQTIDQSPADAAIAAQAGGYCSAVLRIQHLAARPDRVPRDCSADALREMSPARRRARLEALLARCETPPQTLGLLPEVAHRLCANASAMHKKMQRRRYAVSDESIDRAPLARLWTAWRAR